MIDPNTRQKVGHSDLDEVILEQIEIFSEHVRSRDLKWIRPTSKRDDCLAITDRFWPRLQEIQERWLPVSRAGWIVFSLAAIGLALSTLFGRSGGRREKKT